jgi:hypothetical protein
LKKFLAYLIIFVNVRFLFGQMADTTSIFDEIRPEVEHPKEETLYIINPINISKPSINKIKSDAFYDSLESKSQNNKFTNQLHRLLIRNPTLIQTIPKNNQTAYFETYEGKYIRKIVLEQLDVFGPSVYDTSKKAKSWSERLGNSLHISTSKSSIKNFLFISEKEKIDPYILADNERVLRTIPSIQDARIFVVPIEGDNDSVDIKIVTKDVWPVGFAFEAFDVGYGNFSVWNNNILGMGQQLNFKAHYNLNEDPQYGYLASYRVPNIRNTFTTLAISHEEKWNYNANKVHLRRRFITPALKFGFGAGYEKVYEVRNYTTIDTTLNNVVIDYEYYDTWAGYSIPIRRIDQQNIRKTIFLSSRFQAYNYFSPQVVANNYLYEFFTRKIYLSSLGLTWQGYYNTRLVLGFGDTEDIPYGAMLKLTFGKEYNQYSDRYYLGTTIAISHYLENVGFISNKIETGAFYLNKFQQGIFNYEGTYISPLIGGNRHAFRTINRLNYLQGYNRFDDEYIELKNSEGIRGLNYNELKGNKRFYLNSEFVYYSPQYVYGFRFVYYAFIDAGLINYKNNTLFKNPLHSSFGIGVRIRNERLVFNTLQIQLQFFPFEPDLPFNNKRFVDVSGTPKLRIPEFADRVPSIVSY